MKAKKSFLALLLLAATSMFFGCGDPYKDGINWNGDTGGTLEIFNGSNKDIVVFIGQTPAVSTIMGGIKAGKTTSFDPGKYVGEAEYGVGGYTVVRGVTKEQYDVNMVDLSKARVDYMAMATYKKGATYRIQIDGAYIGDYGFRATNRGRVGMELRKDSPEGEKVSYLPALQQNQMIYADNIKGITLFPVYVFYDKKTGEVTTLKATSLFESTLATPRPLQKDNEILTYYFPVDPILSWENLVKTLKSPCAYISVKNNVMNQGAYFTSAASSYLYSQNGYNSIGPGELLVFEVKAAEEEDGGVQTSLVVVLYGGLIMVPVLFEGETTPPVLKNGYNYTVTINGSGQDVSGYTATIVEGQKRDLTDQLISL